MSGREQLLVAEVALADYVHAGSWDWRRGLEVAVCLPASPALMQQVRSQAPLEKDGSVSAVEARELRFAQLGPDHALELVVGLLLGSGAFHRPIRSRDWVSAQRGLLWHCGL